jgi:hypothetical protein
MLSIVSDCFVQRLLQSVGLYSSVEKYVSFRPAFRRNATRFGYIPDGMCCCVALAISTELLIPDGMRK